MGFILTSIGGLMTPTSDFLISIDDLMMSKTNLRLWQKDKVSC